MEALTNLLSSRFFIPHGHCYLWKPGLVTLHAVSDGLIALAYYSIPLTLLYFIQRRQDFPFNWIFILFSSFIFACGTTHVLEVVTVWHPVYWLTGIVKSGTAFVSLYTAITLIPLVPKALAIANPAVLEAVNRELEREIAERKKIEASLRKSEARYRAVVEDQTELICRFLPDNRFTFVNEAYCRYFGRTSEALLGNHWSPVVAEQDLTQIQQQLADLSPTNPVVMMTNRVIRADGEIRTTQWINHALFDHDDQLVELQAVGRDITELQQTEAALQTTQRLIQKVADTAPVILYIYDLLEHKIIYINRQIYELLGYTQVEVEAISDPVTNFLHPEDLEALTTRYCQWNVIQDNDICQHEYRIQDRNRQWHYMQSRETVFSRTSEGAPQQILGAALDITDLKYVQQLKVALREKEVLLKEVHHRVKNNLQIIYSLLRLQSRQIKDQQLAGILLESQNRIKSIALVHEKLYRSDDLSEINLKHYIPTLAASLFSSYNLAPDMIALTVCLDDTVLNIDRAILCGLIINELVSNSLKHAFLEEKKGEVYISISSDRDNFITLIVRDDGIGIPETIDLNQIQSVGLSLVRDLTNQLQGMLEIERFQGTLFKLTFPKT